MSRKEPSHTKTSWKSALSLSDIPCSRRQTILTIDKFCFNYLLWLNVSYFGEKLENVSFIFTKQPTRARFLLKKRPSPCRFPNRVFGLDRCQVKFCPLQTRWDQTNFGYFLQFLQSPLASIRRHGSLNRPCFIKVERIVDYSLLFQADPRNFNNWNPKI